MMLMCRKNECFVDCLVIERDCFVYGNNMILGGIVYGRWILFYIIFENMNVLILRYCNEIFVILVVLFIY